MWDAEVTFQLKRDRETSSGFACYQILITEFDRGDVVQQLVRTDAIVDGEVLAVIEQLCSDLLGGVLF